MRFLLPLFFLLLLEIQGLKAVQEASPPPSSAATAQKEMIPGGEMTVREYDPRSTLVVPGREYPRAKYPFIDFHSHHRPNRPPEEIDQVVRDMDRINMAVAVNLSGGSGERIKAHTANYVKRYPTRFVLFASPDFSGIDEPDWGKKAAAQLEQDVRNGAQGLKLFKNFGLEVKYKDGSRLKVDDPILDPIWEACARLRIPAILHTGEPSEFFQPIDKHNERWQELIEHPDRARPPDKYPRFEELMAERDRLFLKHKNTTFVAAHMGWHANDLARLGKMLDQTPNLYVELAAVIYDFGRQPLTGHDWMVRYQDRVLMGKDIFAASEYPTYFRVLESRDEYFPYYRKYHAFWRMYGLSLPDEVLKKIYYKNALKLLPKIDASRFPR
ncbi:MAG: amidohydrolase family protein [Acidobacteria bacterium]|nr:amidohydrolase family protein [Acidobacteriota bacterium]